MTRGMIERRSALAAGGLLLAGGATRARAAAGGRTFVLVHGAYGGGWVWRYVAPALIARGNVVVTPTLTGLGDRCHLLSAEITVDTHVADVTNTLTFGGLRDVVLVGHSYGGVPVTGAADRMAGAVGRLVYLDALIPENGQRAFDLLPPGMEAERMKQVERRGAGIALPPPAEVGIEPGPAHDWAQARVRPQPVGSYATPLRLTRPAGAGLAVNYLAFVEPALGSIEPSRQRAQRKPGWHYETMATPHNTPLIDPDRLADWLDQVGRS